MKLPWNSQSAALRALWNSGVPRQTPVTLPQSPGTWTQSLGDCTVGYRPRVLQDYTESWLQFIGADNQMGFSELTQRKGSDTYKSQISAPRSLY